MTVTDVAVVGAGPHGLATVARLRRAGVETRIFGEPMGFWRTLPAGMLMRSNWGATNIADLHGEHSLESYQAATGASFGSPVPLKNFIAYGDWVQQQVAPDVDGRFVRLIRAAGSDFELHLEDGEQLQARRVVVAAGIAGFAWVPEVLAGLSRECCSHTGDHRELTQLAGKDVVVVGAGQSSLEAAARLHEHGARVEILVRSSEIVWLRGVGVKRRLGKLGPVVYAPTDVGPLWYSRLVAMPDLFRRLPRRLQTPIAHRSIRAAGAHWLISRLADVPISMERGIRSAQVVGDKVSLRLDDGTTRTVDHVLAGTGYRVDVAKYGFLDAELLSRLRCVDGYPVLRRGLESSVPALHFVGAPAAWSFGPTMRFVSGSWYASAALARCVTGALGPRASRAGSAPDGGPTRGIEAAQSSSR